MTDNIHHKQAGFFKLLAWGSVANLAMPMSAVLTGPLLARALDPAGRGIMAALLVPVSLANLIFTLGIPESLAFHVARSHLSVRRGRHLALCAGSVGGSLAATVVIALGPLLLVNVPPSYWGSYVLLACTLPITITFAAVRGLVRGVGLFMNVNRERILAVVIRLALLVALVTSQSLDPVIATWVTVMSGIFASFWLLPGLMKPVVPLLDAFDTQPIMRFAGGVAVGTLGSFLVMRLDQLMMVPLGETRELGLYAVAVSLAELPLAAVAAVCELMFTISAKKNDPRVVAKLCRSTILVSIPCCAFGAAFAPLIIPLLFGTAYLGAVSMTQVLFAASAFAAIGSVLSVGLMAAGRVRVQSTIQLLGAGLVFGSILGFVPALGGIGAALSKLLTYIVVASATLVAFSHATGISMTECIIPRPEEWSSVRQFLKRIQASIHLAILSDGDRAAIRDALVRDAGAGNARPGVVADAGVKRAS